MSSEVSAIRAMFQIMMIEELDDDCPPLTAGFQNSTFLSERDTADRNHALAYFMRESACFPE